MLRPRFKNARRRHAALRPRVRWRRPPNWRSPHSRAVHELARCLRAGEEITCRFHSGVGWRGFGPLPVPATEFVVRIERPVGLSAKRYVPDLALSCPRSGKLLMLVEVWHSHAVNAAKRCAFNAAGIPWIEVKSWHVLGRRSTEPLPVLDWGGPGLPESPCQGSLFPPPAPLEPPSSNDVTMQQFRDNWDRSLGSRFAPARISGCGAHSRPVSAP